jgi:GTPase Era involved in 16S rRNA processing
LSESEPDRANLQALGADTAELFLERLRLNHNLGSLSKATIDIALVAHNQAVRRQCAMAATAFRKEKVKFEAAEARKGKSNSEQIDDIMRIMNENLQKLDGNFTDDMKSDEEVEVVIAESTEEVLHVKVRLLMTAPVPKTSLLMLQMI